MNKIEAAKAILKRNLDLPVDLPESEWQREATDILNVASQLVPFDTSKDM